MAIVLSHATGHGRGVTCMRWRHSPPAALAVELEEEAEGRQQPLCSRLHFSSHKHTRAEESLG